MTISIFTSLRKSRGIVATGCASLFVSILTALPVQAAPTTWTGGTSNVWSTGVPTNWSAGYSNGDDVTFDDTGANTNITASGTVEPGSITFSNSSLGYIVGGTISGATDLTKNGTATVQLTGNNSFTGKTFLNDGVLSINSDARLGAAPGAVVADQLTFNGGTLNSTGSYSLNVNRGITVGASGGTFDVDSGTQTTFLGNITGPGGLVKTGEGSLFIGPPTDSPNTFAGPLHIQQGTVVVSTVSIGIPLQGDPNPVAPGGFIVESGATLEFRRGGNQTWVDPITLNGGTTVDSLSTNNFMTGDITLTADSVIAKNAATWRIDGAIQGAFGFEKEGGAVLTLNGLNTYNGPTTVSRGTMNVNSGSSLGSTSALTVQNQNTVAGSTVTLNLNHGSQTVGSLSGLIATPSSGTNNANLNLGTNFDLTINQTSDGTFQGVIGGGSAEIIMGASSTAALRLEGENTYGAGTTINGGSLLANNSAGSATGAGAVTVNSTGLLGGTGTIDGDVDVNSGATLNPGDGIGTLTLNGSGGVNLNAGSVFAVEIGGTTPGTFDQLVVQNTANLAGSLDVTFLGGNLGANDSIVILSAGTLVGTFDNAPTEGSMLGLGGVNFMISYLDNQVTLSNFQVPEPSSLVLLGLGSMLLVRKRRRPRTN